MNHNQVALSTAARNMLLNVLLAVAKLTVGALTGSEALLSDGVHGVTDVLSAVVVIVGIRLSASKRDARHPYGHERMECVAAVVLSVLIAATGIYLGSAGAQSLCTPETVTSPGMIALITAGVSLIVKEWMFRATRRQAERTRSAALMADAWHQRTDVFTSLGGLIGVGGACLGAPVLDPVAACVISLLIVRAAVRIFADAMRKMTDCACEDATANDITKTASEADGVLAVESLRTRLFGDCVLCELTVTVDERLSSSEAYGVMCAVKRRVEERVPVVKECAVHIHPIAVANRAEAWYNNE